MKRYTAIFLVLSLVFCTIFATGCEKSKSDTQSSPSFVAHTESENESFLGDLIENKYKIITNYYGLTMKDVIEIWGSDYEINDYLLDDTFAGIYYNNDRCPFVFFYKSNTNFAPTTCDLSAKITSIQVKNFNIADTFLTENIPVTISYDELSTKFDGSYYTDEEYTGNTFKCTSIENVDVFWFTWHYDTNVPTRLLLHFDNATDKNFNTNTNTSNPTQNTSSVESKENTSSTESKNEALQNTRPETEIFADIFRTDYVYMQDRYCSDGRYIYTFGGSKEFIAYDTQTNTYETYILELDKKKYPTHTAKNFKIYNGYVTVLLEVGGIYPSGLLIYKIDTKEIKIIDDMVTVDTAIVFGDYIYTKIGDQQAPWCSIQRSPIDTTDRKWETIIPEMYNEYIVCGNYLFGNLMSTNQMFRLDLYDGSITNYNNDVLVQNVGFLQNDNWFNTNRGIFDVNANCIKYENNYYIYGDTGVTFKSGPYFGVIEIEFLNFKTNEKITKSYTIPEGFSLTPQSKYIAIKGCTYNGIYQYNVFVKFKQENGAIAFETIKGAYSFSGLHNAEYRYGCLFVLNDYIYFVNSFIKKAPLNNISNATSLLKN